MSKFLMQVSLTKEGAKGVAKDGGTKRRQAAEQFFKSAGGKLEALYFAFGDTDVFAIVDFPDNARGRGHLLCGKGGGPSQCQSYGTDHRRGDGSGGAEKPGPPPTGYVKEHPPTDRRSLWWRSLF